MTTPPKEITITCPDCGYGYEDWCRLSIDLSIDDSDDEYLGKTTTTTCPEGRVKNDLGALFVRRDVDGETIFEMSRRGLVAVKHIVYGSTQ